MLWYHPAGLSSTRGRAKRRACIQSATFLFSAVTYRCEISASPGLRVRRALRRAMTLTCSHLALSSVAYLDTLAADFRGHPFAQHEFAIGKSEGPRACAVGSMSWARSMRPASCFRLGGLRPQSPDAVRRDSGRDGTTRHNSLPDFRARAIAVGPENTINMAPRHHA